jgi:hypothetical protein
MFKLGETNWKVPTPIDKLLPRLRVEGAAARAGRPLRAVEPASGEGAAG